MKKICVLLLIPALATTSVWSQKNTNWRTLIDEATYQCDTAPTALLAGDREGFSPEAIETLSRKLAPLLKVKGTELSEANLAAGRTLAAYRSQYFADRNSGLPKWEDPSARFLITGTDTSGTEIALLGGPFTMHTPGKPFQNGRLIAFNAQKLWFEFTDGTLQAYNLDLAFQEDELATPGLTLVTDEAEDNKVLGALIKQMGYTCSILGKPRTLSGQFHAPTMKMLLFEMLEKEGYEVFQKGKDFTFVRPNSTGIVDLEATLRNVSVSEKGGVVRFENASLEEMGFFGPDRDVGDNPKHYAVSAEDGTQRSISLADSEGIARLLLNDSIKRLGNRPADEAAITAHLKKKLSEICLGKPGLQEYVTTTLPKGMMTVIDSETDHRRMRRAKMIIHCITKNLQ